MTIRGFPRKRISAPLRSLTHSKKFAPLRDIFKGGYPLCDILKMKKPLRRAVFTPYASLVIMPTCLHHDNSSTLLRREGTTLVTTACMEDGKGTRLSVNKSWTLKGILSKYEHEQLLVRIDTDFVKDSHISANQTLVAIFLAHFSRTRHRTATTMKGSFHSSNKMLQQIKHDIFLTGVFGSLWLLLRRHRSAHHVAFEGTSNARAA